jgi:hypothetical protein
VPFSFAFARLNALQAAVRHPHKGGVRKVQYVESFFARKEMKERHGKSFLPSFEKKDNNSCHVT